MDSKRLQYSVTLLSLLISVSVFGVDLQPLTIQDFSAGLQTSVDSTLIEDGATQDCQNVDFNSGSLEKRRGSILQNTTAIGSDTSIRFLSEYPDSSGNFWMLLIEGTTIYKSNNAGVTNTVVSSTHGFTATSDIHTVNAFGRCFLTDGTTNFAYFDGSVLSISTSIPKGKLVEFWAERLWTADVASNRSVLYASRVSDWTDWTDDNVNDDDSTFENIRLNNGYPIRCIKRFRNNLVIFKDYSMDLLTLASDGVTFYLTSVSNTIGTQHPNSVQEVNGVLKFLGRDGWYAYNGTSVQKTSTPIDETVKNIKQLNSDSSNFVVTTKEDFEDGSIIALNTTQTSGSLIMSTNTIIDDFSDSNYDTNPKWTVYGNIHIVSYFIFSKALEMTLNTSYTTDIASMTFDNSQTVGVWSFNFDCWKNATTQPQESNIFTFSLLNNNTTSYSLIISSRIATVIDSSSNILSSSTFSSSIIRADTTNTTPQYKSISIERNANSVWTISVGTYTTLSFTNSSVKSFSGCSIKGTGSVNAIYFDDFKFLSKKSTFIAKSNNAGSSISSWREVLINDSLDSATINYALYSDTDTIIDIDNQSSFVSSQTIINNQTPTISTNSYVCWSAIFTRVVSTETAQIDSFTVSWTLGTSFPVASCQFEGDYLCAVSLNDSTKNDTIFVHDRNNRWSKYTGLPAYCMTTYRQKPYFGSNSAGDIYRFQADDVYNDNGVAIDSYWTSKDFNFGYVLGEKTLQRYYITADYDSSSDALFEYGCNKGSLTSTTLDLDLTSGFYRKTIIPSTLTYQKGITHRFKISDNDISNRFKILGITIKARLETEP